MLKNEEVAPDSGEVLSGQHVKIVCAGFAAAGAGHALHHAEVN